MNTVFLKNAAGTNTSAMPRSTIYYEPFTMAQTRDLRAGTRLIAVPAIRPSFVDALFQRKTTQINVRSIMGTGNRDEIRSGHIACQPCAAHVRWTICTDMPLRTNNVSSAGRLARNVGQGWPAAKAPF